MGFTPRGCIAVYRMQPMGSEIAERLTCSRAGYFLDKRSVGINAPLTNQINQFSVHRPTNIYLMIFIKMIYLCEPLRPSAAENE